MREFQFQIDRLLILLIAAIMVGCASSASTGRLDHLEGKLSDQESRLTRLQQSMSVSKTKQRYLSDQVEMMSAGRLDDYREVGKAKVLFGFNEYDLSPEGKKSLDQLAESLADDPYAMIEIRGHTDAVGSPQYNYMLGELRAEAVARYLHKQFRIPLYRLNRISYGEENPASVSQGDERLAASRRVEVRVLSIRSSGESNLP